MAAPQSPAQTIGPFFHDGLVRPGAAILVNEQTRGRKIHLTGTVYDGGGVPVSDALVEIWQADGDGIFQHRSDPRHGDADPNFRGFGRSDTAREGCYSFRTVKPGRSHLDEESQSPYIRMHVFSRGMLRHATTRIYFADEDNSGDSILAAVPERRRGSLIATFEPPDTYRFDIHLQGDNETVFFDI